MATKTCPQCGRAWETPFCPMCGVRLDEEVLGDLMVYSDERHEMEKAGFIGPRGERISTRFQYTGGSRESRYWTCATPPEKIAVGTWTVVVGRLRLTTEVFPDTTTEVDLIDEGYIDASIGDDDDDEDYS